MIIMMTRDTDLTSNRLFSNNVETIRMRDFIKKSFIFTLKYMINKTNHEELLIDSHFDDVPMRKTLTYRLLRAGICLSELDRQKYDTAVILADANNGTRCCKCGRLFSFIGILDSRYCVRSETDDMMCDKCEKELKNKEGLKWIISSIN